MLQVDIPIRTVPGMNVREHWSARARRVKFERAMTAWALKGIGSIQRPDPTQGTVTVRLTRYGPSNGLDGDNLQGSAKAVRDQVAEWLGVDDRSPLINWQYDQVRTRHDWGIRVTIDGAHDAATTA